MKIKRKDLAKILTGIMLTTTCLGTTVTANESTPLPTAIDSEDTFNLLSTPQFRNVSVHDPSIIKTDGMYYVFGSHLASAKSNDLLNWTQLSTHVHNGNVLIPNVTTELREAFEWAETDTLWAADVIKLPDGKFYMYYNACKGDSPRSAMGIAVADKIEGPYKNKGIFLKSGMWGQQSEDGTIYDATKHPNAVDPNVFFDKDGQLWMVYGSYSGGIYIMKMNPQTGFPYPNQGYGKKLIGANHSRIEAPYIMYSPESDYYYLFLSYGGLDADGGYNIRMARSKTPDGPYRDTEGNDITNVGGKAGSFFDDAAIAPYGAKIMGNFAFNNNNGKQVGYVSPGHNSAYYERSTGKYFLFFHTRFPSRGEQHEVRVHQMFMNKDGWLVTAPYRYANETAGSYKKADVVGNYLYINHGKDITANIKGSTQISFNDNGTISGSVSGTWRLKGKNNIELVINGQNYNGVFVRQWNEGLGKNVMTFTALSAKGESAWGSRIE